MILVRQFRAGAGELTWELPGGAVDPNEDYSKAVMRELAEETGYQGSSARQLLSISPNPAFQNNKCITFFISDARLVGDQSLDPLEEIEVKEFSIPDVKRMLVEQEINHSLIVAALAYYFLFPTNELTK